MIRFLLILCLLLNWNVSLALSEQQIEQAKTRLAIRYDVVAQQIHDNDFGMPLVLQSSLQDNHLQGQIIGILDVDFTSALSRIDAPDDWCDILMLHINTKACTYKIGDSSNGTIHLYTGRKHYQTPREATRLSMDFSKTAYQDDYLAISMLAKTGPLGTSDYLIQLEAAPLVPTNGANSEPKTLVRMTFSYRTNWLSRQAIKLYLATLARNKVGFTVVDTSNNNPVYIKGLEGIIERNTARYFLAIKARLDTPDQQPPQRRFSNWFDATQRFKRQLGEISKQDYLNNKQKELENQQREQAIIDQQQG